MSKIQTNYWQPQQANLQSPAPSVSRGESLSSSQGVLNHDCITHADPCELPQLLPGLAAGATPDLSRRRHERPARS